jgi:phosphopantothenoylcysteine decarboxylase / phosphopantothenate---cysteine ligase
MKNKKTIVIGISSGIAGYKMLDLIDLIKNVGLDIHVLMTKHAVEMFGVSEFERRSGNNVNSSIIPEKYNYKDTLTKREVKHIRLADNADILLIAPTTANIIGKLANGIADDFLTTVALAVSCPIILCPSMNPHMWENQVVQENIKRLKNRGYIILDPDFGDLACGYKGKGRLIDINLIHDEILHILKIRNSLKGIKVIVTGGASTEPIDGVRIITNRGSGKMGKEIADECVKRGAEVLYLKSKSSAVSGLWQKEETFETTNDLFGLLEKYAPLYNLLYHTASVSDFKPCEIISGKKESSASFSLMLIPTKKIINFIKIWNPKIKLIGFKAYYKLKNAELIKIIRNKFKESKADYLVANDVGEKGIGFGAEDNEISIFSEKGLIVRISKMPKKYIAGKIIDYSCGAEVSTTSPGFSQ